MSIKIIEARKNYAFTRMQEIFDLSKKISDEQIKLEFLRKAKTIPEIRVEFVEYLEKYFELSLGVDDKFKINYAPLNSFDDMYATVNSIYAGLEEKRIQKIKRASEDPTVSIVQPRLPKLQIPDFHGNQEEWPVFYQLFTKLIHENKNISKLEKLNYLVTHLHGPAKSICSGILPTEENYDILFTSLVERYEDKRSLISTYFDKLLNFRSLNNESERGLNNFLEQFVEANSALKQLEVPDLYDHLITHIALKKLDSQTVKQFEMSFREKNIPTFDSLVKFIKEQVKILNRTSKINSYKAPVNNSATKQTHSFMAQNQSILDSKNKSSISKRDTYNFRCFLCNDKLHPLYFCSVFQKMPVPERLLAVKQRKACFNCLSIGKHNVKDCQSKNVCNKCNRRHHTLLHNFSSPMESPSKNLHDESISSKNAEVQVGLASDFPSSVASNTKLHNPVDPQVYCATTKNAFAPQMVLLSTAVISVRDRGGNYHDLRALLDPGSQSNFITKAACDKLNLPQRKTDLFIKGIGSNPVPVQYYTTVSFKSLKHPYPSFSLDAVVLDNLIDTLPTVSINLNQLSHIKHIPLADNRFHIPDRVDLLLGAELWPLVIGTKRIFGPPNTPVALESAFGYLIMGRAPIQFTTPICKSFCVCQSSCLEPLMKKFWSLEEIPAKTSVSPNEEDCERQFLQTWKRLPEGKFSVALPFKEPVSQLGASHNLAIKKFISLENRLLKNTEMYSQFKDIMNDYLDKGFMSLVTEDAGSYSDSYFLPYHGVIKKESTSTPLRIVFNASAPTDNGYSLNDILHVGPKLQNSIIDILLNFRLFSFALCTDISKMYLQIFIHSCYRRYQRLVWRFSPRDKLQVFELNTVTFGVASSPYLAQRVIRQLASIEESNYPLAAVVACRDIYVDDIATSVETEEQANKLYHELRNLFKSGGFPLAKWSSSSPKLNKLFQREVQQDVQFDKENHTKVLGIRWTPSNDTFSYCISDEIMGNTKRAILSIIAKIFDPLGLLAPILTTAKLVMKELWEQKIGWDEEPPDIIMKKWNQFLYELPSLSAIRIPRHCSITTKSSSILVGFADASEKAYGAVVYVRSEYNSKITVQLLCAKSKVAPSQSVITIPRLELCAALILSKLVRHVLNVYEPRYKFQEVIAFSDSMVVLHWLSSAPAKWKIFVSNRISQIRENVDQHCWRHVKGEDNPADCLSRGLTPAALKDHPLWFHGPSWLSGPLQYWPQNVVVDVPSDDVASECKHIMAMTTKIISESVLDCLLNRCSTFKRLLRITAYVFRVFRKSDKHQLFISTPELQQAEKFWILKTQERHFSQIKHLLTSEMDLPPQFAALDLFLKDDVIRVGGRLQLSNLHYDRKHPALLPKKDRLVELIIENCHTENLHAGPQLVFSILRHKYWIISARSEIRRLLRACNICFKVKPTSIFPKMAPLPSFRVKECKAFLNTGVDYCGPFMITVSRRRGARAHKAYVCLFICLAVKAVHLELAYDLSTPSFLGAFKRFIARRGFCARIQSDNATNFIGARNHLNEYYALVQSREFNDAIGSELAAKRIEWHFNPPDSPHFGGIWEANIKSVKTHLKRVIGNHILSYDEFNTILVQVEALLNSRPLCVMSDDVNAPSALTPSHFLTLGSPLDEIPAQPITQEPLNRLLRYQLLDRIVQDFWKKWKEDYLQSLQIRHRWTKTSHSITEGMVVILKKENLPPLKWPLGIVQRVYPGQDGIIRVIDVKTRTGVYRRSVTKVCPLPRQ